MPHVEPPLAGQRDRSVVGGEAGTAVGGDGEGDRGELRVDR